MDVWHLLEVAVPVVGAVWYLGRQLGEIKTLIGGTAKAVDEIKSEDLPVRVARIETHLELTR